MKILKQLFFICSACVMLMVPMLLTACSADSEEYHVVYDLNYEDAGSRTVSVQAGRNAISWRPYRDGYDMEGWYKDKACKRPFDFSKKIGKDVVLYANWVKDPENYQVVFNGNYAGADTPEEINVPEGTKLSETDAPENSRLGFALTGWYTDEECTDPWDFENDVVYENTVLYAGYEYDNSVARNEQGKPIFDNVTINVWCGTQHYTKGIFDQITAEFNEEYEGKIKVNYTNDLFSQDLFSLRFMQTPSKNSTNNAYYVASDIYDLAGLDSSSSLWYENAISDSYDDGKLYSIPIIASVPYLIYNKPLMYKYNGQEAVPSQYSEFTALFEKVYAGESQTKSNFHTILSKKDWTFEEATSCAAFVQNGAEYYTYEDGAYVSKWYDEEVLSRAVTGLENLYAMFGKNGKLHGAFTDVSEYTDDTVIHAVSNGDAFMGIVNLGVSTVNLVKYEDNIGIMPLGGLFSDDEANRYKVPVHTFSLSFYKAGAVSNTELAASAVFADYVSKNSWRFASSGYWPLRRSVVEGEDFNNNPSASFAADVELIQRTGYPEDFVTLSGNKNEKTIISTDASHDFIMPFLKEENDSAAKEAAIRFRNLMLGDLL